MARGIRKITFLRHANAVAADGAPDKMRRLSDKGQKQAQRRREQLGNPDFDLVICSQVIRTAETALEVAGDHNHAPVIMFHELFTPHSGPVHDALDRLFKKIGHRTISDYYAEGSGDVELMRNFGGIGWQKIMDEFYSNNSQNLLVVGHGMYMVLMACEGTRVSGGYGHAECLVDLVQGECDGFVVTFEFDEKDCKYYVNEITPLPPLE